METLPAIIITALLLAVFVAVSLWQHTSRQLDSLRDQVEDATDQFVNHDLEPLRFYVGTHDGCWAVFAELDTASGIRQVIRIFPHTPFDDDDRAYARRCAEELTDKLNETV